MKIRIRLWALSLLVAVGCDKRTDAPPSVAQPKPAADAPLATVSAGPTVLLIKRDPAASFEEFASRYVKEANATYKSHFEPLPPTIDVRKTDSLINPHVGTINISYKSSSDSKSFIGYSVKSSTYTFVVENDKWVLQSAIGDTIVYDKQGHPMSDGDPLDDGDPLSRTVRAAKVAPMPDEESARKAAEGIQK